MDILTPQQSSIKALFSNKITIEVPDYKKDRIIWKVKINSFTMGEFFSMWEAEQYAKELKHDYPLYELEVVK